MPGETDRLRRLRGLFRPRPLHPAQVISLAFATAGIVGTVLLMLPISRSGPGGTGFTDALFHATSAICVTGLSAVDTAEHWTGFGQAVLLVLVQVGGLGIMTFASILGLVVARRLGLRTRLQTTQESGIVDQGDLRRLLWGVARISLKVEILVAIALTLRWWLGYDERFVDALWLGVFHAVAAFNNAGFALWSDNLMGFVSDPFICLPIAVAVILGGLGFPVLMELRRQFRWSIWWTINTKIVISVSIALLVSSTIAITALEWSNPATLGQLDPAGRLLAGFFQAVNTRTAGFNSVDTAELNPATWFLMDALMFIGGGPAGTGGGIKVTTFAVLLLIVYAEIRGEGAVNVFGKRLPRSAQRQAITVAALAFTVISVATGLLMVIEGLDLDRSLFEAISAFTTTGLSAGVTGTLSDASKYVLVFLMFAGRLGPITLASAIALRSSNRLYEYPKERPIIG
ncbi:MAG: TrkH family potassium uptake protein [Solirubrobacteraceae bacterium]|nr:TrkH family potassium uptake protein [Solirubrobacteraceae bacterium]